VRPVALVGAAILALAGLVLPAAIAACAMVCVAPDDYEAMLRGYRHVLVGRVEHVPVSSQPIPREVDPGVKGGKAPRENRL
jgi:hypothetical protein